MVDAVELVKRLREACNGHPHAKIPWPHRILHEAATVIESLVAERDEARRLAQTLLQAGQEDLVLMTETAATLTSLRSRAEAAESKLDRAIEDADSYKASMKQYFEQSLSEHNAKVLLAKALKPFADAIDRYEKHWNDETGGQPGEDDSEKIEFMGWLGEYFAMVTLGDLRHARSTLDEIDKP